MRNDALSSMPTEFADVNALLAIVETGASVHVECNRSVSAELAAAVRQRFAGRRCAWVMEADGGFSRHRVTDYLRLFSHLAGGGVHHEDAIAHFGLREVARRRMDKLAPEERALVHIARASLYEPEICFMERPLSDVTAEGRTAALAWIVEREEAGCRFITTLQSMRQALLLPGIACWYEDGRFFVVSQDTDDELNKPAITPGQESNSTDSYLGDEVHVLKIPAKTDTATLLFDPREIDFAESANKATYLSVRGELYQTPRTMDELEAELSSSGFFRCHRSYLVNVQRVAKVERYTRNSFNLTLNDAAHSSIPLAKGRIEEMRSRYGW